MTLNKDFALIDSEGYYRYPYITQSRDKNIPAGYQCNPYAHRVPANERLSVSNIEEVIVGVIENNWNVRVMRDPSETPAGVASGNAGARFQGKEFQRFWLAPQYRHLITKHLDAMVTSPYSNDSAETHTLQGNTNSAQPWPYSVNPTTSASTNNLIDDPKQLIDSSIIDPEVIKAAELEIAADPSCQHLSTTERSTLVMARIGQGDYRNKMIALWDGKCALTGLGLQSILIASHAKPWKLSTNAERLNPYNGFLLSANIDKLFDQGFISFNDRGELLTSPKLSSSDLVTLGLSSNSRLASSFNEQHIPFLREHRKLFGFDE